MILLDETAGMTPLTDPQWQPISKPNFDGDGNNINVMCTDDELSLTVNGVEEAKISSLTWKTSGHGKMGIFVVANDGTGPEGFRVLIDNVNVWK